MPWAPALPFSRAQGKTTWEEEDAGSRTGITGQAAAQRGSPGRVRVEGREGSCSGRGTEENAGQACLRQVAEETEHWPRCPNTS